MVENCIRDHGISRHPSLTLFAKVKAAPSLPEPVEANVNTHCVCLLAGTLLAPLLPPLVNLPQYPRPNASCFAGPMPGRLHDRQARQSHCP